MTPLQNSSPKSPAAISQPDNGPNNMLWPRWGRNADWRDNLEKRATHKALDIPEDDVNISVQKGMGWKELAIVGALAGAAAWAGSLIHPNQTTTTTNNPPAVVQPAVLNPMVIPPTPATKQGKYGLGVK